MKVVVIGATGNVGSRVVAALSADPAVTSVIGVARRPARVAAPHVRWQSADITRDPLHDLLASVDAVIHLAWLIQPARDLAELRRVNIDGTRRVIDAAIACGVPTVVYASSVGTYAPDSSGIPRDESWPHTGIASSTYSRHKAEIETYLDALAAGATRIVRLRTALVFQRHAASEIARLFLGSLVPSRLLGRRGLPLFPDNDALRLQVVHAADAAQAYLAALHHPEASGPFNIATEPTLTTRDLATVFDGRPLWTPRRLIRAAAAASFAARLQPTHPGWVDLAFGAPVMDTARARTQLAWRPRHGAVETVEELRDGLASGDGTGTPPLRPKKRRLAFPTVAEQRQASTGRRP